METCLRETLPVQKLWQVFSCNCHLSVPKGHILVKKRINEVAIRLSTGSMPLNATWGFTQWRNHTSAGATSVTCHYKREIYLLCIREVTLEISHVSIAIDICLLQEVNLMQIWEDVLGNHSSIIAIKNHIIKAIVL